MCFSTKWVGVSMPLSTIRGAEIENKGCIPSLPWRRAASEASGKWSCIFSKWISSGLRRHLSITSFKYCSGYWMNWSMHISSAKTQYFSVYLKTPRLGLPGISKPFYWTMLTRQKPRKSRGMCMKSGVLFGIKRIMLEFEPTTYESVLAAICSSIWRILCAFSM